MLGFITWGPRADQYGKKRIMLAGLVIIVVSTAACGFVTTIPLLATLRAVQGFACSSFAPAALAYLADATSEKHRATALAAMSTGFLVAGIVG